MDITTLGNRAGPPASLVTSHICRFKQPQKKKYCIYTEHIQILTSPLPLFPKQGSIKTILLHFHIWYYKSSRGDWVLCQIPSTYQEMKYIRGWAWLYTLTLLSCVRNLSIHGLWGRWWGWRHLWDPWIERLLWCVSFWFGVVAESFFCDRVHFFQR